VHPYEIVRNFGEDDAIGSPSEDQTGPEVAEAWFQHHLVRMVRGNLASRGTKESEFVALLGKETTLDTFQRKMRGEALISYDDMLRWVVLLGTDILPELADDSLFPPEHREWLIDWTPASLRQPTFHAPPARLLQEVDWTRAGDWALKRAEQRVRRQRGHLSDDSVLRADLLDYLLTDRLPIDMIHLKPIGPTPGLEFAPPCVGALGCVWVPDLPTNDAEVTASLCRLVVLLHVLAEMSLPHLLAAVSIPHLPALTLVRWYTGLGDVRRRMTFTFGRAITETLAEAEELGALRGVTVRDVTVELMTTKLNPSRNERQIIVLQVLRQPAEAARLKLA